LWTFTKTSLGRREEGFSVSEYAKDSGCNKVSVFIKNLTLRTAVYAE
jgi:hypothetical protein